MPVVGHGLEPHRLADVDQVEDVLLEAGAPKAHAGVEELAANARVCADGVAHLQQRRTLSGHLPRACELSSHAQGPAGQDWHYRCADLSPALLCKRQ